AWYQKTINIPASWKSKDISLFIERSHWESQVWIDDQFIGMRNSLGTPHVFNLTEFLKPGSHRLNIRIDNRVKDIDVGQNSHSISDHTQSNWNGMVGELSVKATPLTHLDDIQLYPDIQNKQVIARIKINTTHAGTKAQVTFQAASDDPNAEKLKPLTKTVVLNKEQTELEVAYPMG